MNTHSTAVMSKLGRVTGNTMTNVRAGNLKLIGRATYLIQRHVNNRAAGQITYNEANAVLFNAMMFLNEQGITESPVPISIIQILQSQKDGQKYEVAKAFEINREIGLERYLE